MEKLKALIEKAESLLNKIDSYDSGKALEGEVASEIKSIHVQGRLLIKNVDKFTLEEYSNLFSRQPNGYYDWYIWKNFNLIEFEKCIGILKAIYEVGPEIAIDKSKTNIFISHGKFNPAFANLETFIRAIGCFPIYDINEPTDGKTINQHVSLLMEKAAFYIVLVSFETTNVSGTKLPNHNVIIEYDRLVQSKIDTMIVFLEEGCTMPSMLQEVIWVPFTERCMDKAFIKLAAELKAHNLL